MIEQGGVGSGEATSPKKWAFRRDAPIKNSGWMNFLTTRGLSTVVINSVARTFLSEIADFGPIYRQIRQVFGSKSRKIR